MSSFSVTDARELLEKAGLFFSTDPDDPEEVPFAQMINLNDVFGWACADGESVPDAELPRVAELFWRYGWCGVLYWVSERRGQDASEFHDNNRFIEFVRIEEAIREEIPDSTKRAYTAKSYTIGQAAAKEAKDE